MNPALELSYEEVVECAREFDLELAAVLSLDEATRGLERYRESLEHWQRCGYAGEMEYMEREAALFCELRQKLPSVQSLVCFAVSYFQNDNPGDPPLGYGKIARYAWGRDYHRVLKQRMKRFIKRMNDRFGGQIEWRGFSDAVPLLERALAAHSGLGFIGKNTMLIRPGLGSFTFLAEVLWNVAVEMPCAIVENRKNQGGCGSCTRCLTHCPTDAFRGVSELDARRCISYLTIEKKTAFEQWERHAVNHWLFGCDICQDVCPFNHREVPRDIEEQFAAGRGVGPFLSLDEVLNMSERVQFTERFAGTALMRAGRQGLVRNACAVAANTRYLSAIPQLMQCAAEDGSAMVRSQARDALRDLSFYSYGLDRRRITALLRSR